MKTKQEVSPIDEIYLQTIRESVTEYTTETLLNWVKPNCNILNIGKQKTNHVESVISDDCNVDTFDIDPFSGATYIGDICEYNLIIPDNTYDVIVCTEVIEHVNDPFSAAIELNRMLKPSGILILTTPFNFRVHGPLPDNWRFTKYGLQILFSNKRWEMIDYSEIDSERFLMPIHSRLTAKKI